MRPMYLLSFAFLTLVFATGSPVRAELIDIPIPLINAGAEAGDLTGWTPIGAASWQVSNAHPAPEGSRYFETNSASINPGLVQTIDLTHLAGSIENIMLSASVAADFGYDEVDQSGTYLDEFFNWYATPRIRFFDANMIELPIVSFGPSAAGSSTFEWTDVQHSWASSRGFDEHRHSITFLQIVLQGAWRNLETGIYEEGSGGYLLDPPEYTRFDNVGLTVTVPDPATLALVSFGALAIIHRRHRNQ